MNQILLFPNVIVNPKKSSLILGRGKRQRKYINRNPLSRALLYSVKHRYCHQPIIPCGENIFKRCSQCKEIWEIDRFHYDKTKPYGHQSICKFCKTERYSHKGRSETYTTKYEKSLIHCGENIFRKCNKCKEIKVLSEFPRFHDRNRKHLTHEGICFQCKNKTGKRVGYFHIPNNERVRIYDQKIKKIVINHYSNGTNVCAYCGIDHFEFLTIDHINGGGNKHRREISKGIYPCSGRSYWNWIIKNNFPDGYQVLCFNCNFVKGPHGGYSHRDEIRS